MTSSRRNPPRGAAPAAPAAKTPTQNGIAGFWFVPIFETFALFFWRSEIVLILPRIIISDSLRCRGPLSAGVSPMRPEEWNLLHNLAKKHLATNFAADLGDDEEGPDFWPSSIALGAMKLDRWEKYLEHLLHRLRLLREKPRALEEGEECPRIMVKGLISDYDRNKELSKQPKPEAELELEFDADQVKEYGELNRFVEANWNEMKTRNGAKKMVHLATMELRFWHGCDITWPSTTADAPATCNAPASGRASEAASSRQASRRGVSAAPSAEES